MIDRVPYVSEEGDSKYTILRDYDHIIASLEVAIDNIIKSQTLINEKNSLSLSHLNTMRENYNENLFKLIAIRDNYIDDRDILMSEINKTILYHD